MGGFFEVDPSAAGTAFTQVADTAQCKHCGKHWKIERGSGKQRGFCRNCMGVTCGAKRCTDTCEPVEKMLERMEAEFAIQVEYDRILTEMAAERAS